MDRSHLIPLSLSLSLSLSGSKFSLSTLTRISSAVVSWVTRCSVSSLPLSTDSLVKKKEERRETESGNRAERGVRRETLLSFFRAFFVVVCWPPLLLSNVLPAISLHLCFLSSSLLLFFSSSPSFLLLLLSFFSQLSSLFSFLFSLRFSLSLFRKFTSSLLGHYWSAGSGLLEHQIGIDSLRWPRDSDVVWTETETERG
jgi:hypothetical protein